MRREYVSALMSAGYAHIPETKPHIGINHVLRKLKPLQLYHRMLDIIIVRKNESFHKQNFDRFVREVAVQVEKFKPNTEDRSITITILTVRTLLQWKRLFPLSGKPIQDGTSCSWPPQTSRKHNDDLRGKKRKRDASEAPLC